MYSTYYECVHVYVQVWPSFVHAFSHLPLPIPAKNRQKYLLTYFNS